MNKNKKGKKKGIIIMISVLLIAALAGAFFVNVYATDEEEPRKIQRE